MRNTWIQAKYLRDTLSPVNVEILIERRWFSLFPQWTFVPVRDDDSFWCPVDRVVTLGRRLIFATSGFCRQCEKVQSVLFPGRMTPAPISTDGNTTRLLLEHRSVCVLKDIKIVIYFFLILISGV